MSGTQSLYLVLDQKLSFSIEIIFQCPKGYRDREFCKNKYLNYHFLMRNKEIRKNLKILWWPKSLLQMFCNYLNALSRKISFWLILFFGMILPSHLRWISKRDNKEVTWFIDNYCFAHNYLWRNGTYCYLSYHCS